MPATHTKVLQYCSVSQYVEVIRWPGSAQLYTSDTPGTPELICVVKLHSMECHSGQSLSLIPIVLMANIDSFKRLDRWPLESIVTINGRIFK